MGEILLSLTQLIIVVCFLFFLIQRLDREKEREENSSLSNTTVMHSALEAVSKMQIQYFSQLTKHSKEQLSVLEKQHKAFLNFLLEKEKEPYEERVTSRISPDLVENTIEKEETEDIPLSDTDRIPIVDGVKLKFEDDEKVYDMDITSVGSSIDQL